MDRSLASLIDNLSEINKKKPMDEFNDNFRSMQASLSGLLNDLSEINKKIRKSENKFIDNRRSMSSSLSCLVDDFSEINMKKPEDKFIDSLRSMSSLLLSFMSNLSVINNKELELENKFIDNLRSVLASRSCLLDYLSEINKKISLIELSEKFPNAYRFCNRDLNTFSLLLRKGVYPYKYMDSRKRFNETELPDKESFYSGLNKEGITDEDYVHTQKISDVFKIKNLGEYNDLYVQSDTLLLADVFENFRDKCIEIYQLDPARFLSVPRLAWLVCLKKTGVELELLTDNDMLIMYENEIRGGMCNSIYRYAKANDKYMKNFDKNVPPSHLEYLDSNNLYGWTMSEKLPVSDFKWIESNDLSTFNEKFVKNYDENSDIRYILEVDLEYSENLHKLHRDLPFLPEKMKINKSSKLVCTLYDKENYITPHIGALKQALNHGLVLQNVHWVITFYQEALLKPYIDMNTKLRTEAKNDFEKDFFKLMNNSVFGKTMENVRNHRDIKIVTTNKQRNKYASEPNYHTTKRISKNLLIMEMKKTEVKMNKPIYFGQAILDISKTLMYEFWYDYIKLNYGDKARLCYMDTDSFIIHIETEDFYKDGIGDVEKWFDTSNYDKND